MRIYKVIWQEPDMGVLQSWHASKREAEKALRHQQQELGDMGGGNGWIDAVDIPTTRAGLLNWLNTCFTTDNG